MRWSAMQTFVVRIWVPPAAEHGLDGLHGVVEHMGTGRRAPFQDDRELLAFLYERSVQEGTAGADGQDGGDAVRRRRAVAPVAAVPAARARPHV
jgi:hypothetical protein